MFQRAAPKPSRSGKPVLRKAPLEIDEHRYVPAQVRVPGQGWKMLDAETANRIARKSTGGVTAAVTARRERELFRAIDKGFRDAERAVLAELREAERSNRALWHRCHTFLRREVQPRPKQHRATKTGFVRSAWALPKFSGPIIDRMGRRGIFLRVRYYGNKTTKRGVATVAVAYIWNGAVEVDGELRCLSNVGESFAETLAAFDHLEQINRAGQANAKVAFHMIANLPFELSLDQMMAVGTRFCEQAFGDHDLPYALALHAPAPESDQRNWHLHLIFSFRPMVRVGDHQWDIGDQLHTELDNADAFRRLRERYADIQTEITQDAGFDHRYTALSYSGRGLPIKPGIHYGPVRTAMARRGESVEAVAINDARMIAGTTAMIDERLRHIAEGAAADLAAVGRVLGRYAGSIGSTMSQGIGETRALIKSAPFRAQPTNTAASTIASPLLTAATAAISAVSNLKLPLSVARPEAIASSEPPAVAAHLPIRSQMMVWTSLSVSDAPPEPSMPAPRPFIATGLPLGVAQRPVVSPIDAWQHSTPQRSTTSLDARIASRPIVSMPRSGAFRLNEPLAVAMHPPRSSAEPILLLPVTMPVRSVRIFGTALAPISLPPTRTSIMIPSSHMNERPVFPAGGTMRNLRPPFTAVALPSSIATGGIGSRQIDEMLEHLRLKKERVDREKAAQAASISRQGVAQPIMVADAPAARMVSLIQRDDWVDEGDAGFTIGDTALVATGRSRAWMMSAEGQAELAGIAADQEGRMIAIIDRATHVPRPIRFESGQARLGPEFDDDARRSFERWIEDPAFLRYAASVFWQLRGPPTVQRLPAPAATAGGAWLLARQRRQAATADWDTIARHRAVADHRPGRAIDGTGEKAARGADRPQRTGPGVDPVRSWNDVDRSG